MLTKLDNCATCLPCGVFSRTLIQDSWVACLLSIIQDVTGTVLEHYLYTDNSYTYVWVALVKKSNSGTREECCLMHLCGNSELHIIITVAGVRNSADMSCSRARASRQWQGYTPGYWRGYLYPYPQKPLPLYLQIVRVTVTLPPGSLTHG